MAVNEKRSWLPFRTGTASMQFFNVLERNCMCCLFMRPVVVCQETSTMDNISDIDTQIWCIHHCTIRYFSSHEHNLTECFIVWKFKACRVEHLGRWVENCGSLNISQIDWEWVPQWWDYDKNTLWIASNLVNWIYCWTSSGSRSNHFFDGWAIMKPTRQEIM